MGHRVVCSGNIGGENCIDLKIDFLNLYNLNCFQLLTFGSWICLFWMFTVDSVMSKVAGIMLEMCIF